MHRAQIAPPPHPQASWRVLFKVQGRVGCSPHTQPVSSQHAHRNATSRNGLLHGRMNSPTGRWLAPSTLHEIIGSNVPTDAARKTRWGRRQLPRPLYSCGATARTEYRKCLRFQKSDYQIAISLAFLVLSVWTPALRTITPGPIRTTKLWPRCR